MKGNFVHDLRAHLGLFFAEAICVSAFVIELSRALSGNTLSWAYVVEWPILGAYAIYMWRKLLHDEESATPAAPSESARDDQRLEEWNEYLAKVHGEVRSDHERKS
jgi:hypothetical protein